MSPTSDRTKEQIITFEILHLVGKHSPYAILVVNAAGEIILINELAQELFGYSQTEVIGRAVEILIPEQDRHAHATNRQKFQVAPVTRAMGVGRDLWGLRKDGTKVPVEIGLAPVQVLQETVILSTIIDITERKRYVQSERDLREMFVATLTHDLRTPLTLVKMSAQMIQNMADHPDSTLEYASRIVKGVNQADQMIQNLLDAEQFRAGKALSFELQECDLSALIDSALKDLSVIHGDRFVVIGNQDVKGFWNELQLRRVVENLCSNAVKYGAPGRPIQVILKRMTNQVAFSVHNEGNPITPENLKIIFMPYARLKTTQAEKQQGWGLGLTVVQGVTEALGGVIEVDSTPEKGTTFTVTLPLDSRIK